MKTMGHYWAIRTFIQINRVELDSLKNFAESSGTDKGRRALESDGILGRWANYFKSAEVQRLCHAKPGELKEGWTRGLSIEVEVTNDELHILVDICNSITTQMGVNLSDSANRLGEQFQAVLDDASKRSLRANGNDDSTGEIDSYYLADAGAALFNLDELCDSIAIRDPGGELVGFIVASHLPEAEIIVSALNSWS